MGLAAGGMLTVAPQFHAIPRLLAVVAAVFPVGTAGLHRALAGRVRTLLRVRHLAPPISERQSRLRPDTPFGTHTSTLRLPLLTAKPSQQIGMRTGVATGTGAA